MKLDRYRYAIIGTGREIGTEGATGFGMAHSHIGAFTATDRVDLVAVADIVEENAQHFLTKYERTDARIYTDYHEMLEQEKPHIVSITTWPHLHAEMTIAACESGALAVHCEKPMATSWGDAKRMADAAAANGVILTFNHQRRFLDPFQKARQLIRDGAVGKLARLEATCGDLFDWGTHWINMLFFLNEETPVEWVIGQIDSRTENRIFGAFTENQGIAHFKFANDVRALLITGYEANIGAAMRIIGDQGIIEIGWDSKVLLRANGDADWKTVEVTESIHGSGAIPKAAADLIAALDDPAHKPLLSVENALRTTEVIFAAYESSRRRGRIDLPLQFEGSALLTLLEAGAIGPHRSAD